MLWEGLQEHWEFATSLVPQRAGAHRASPELLQVEAGGHSQTVTVQESALCQSFPGRDTTTTKALEQCPYTREQPQSRDFQAGDVLLFLSSQLALPVLLVPGKVTCPGMIVSISFGMFNTPEAIQWFHALQQAVLHTEFTSGHWNTVQHLFFCWKYLINQYA